MGFFSMLGMIAGNILEIKNLDRGSDIHIATICEFQPLNVTSSVKKQISQYVKNMYLNNLGPDLSVVDVALAKLTLYSQVFTSGREHQAIQNGIRTLLAMPGSMVRADIRLEASMVLDVTGPDSHGDKRVVAEIARQEAETARLQEARKVAEAARLQEAWKVAALARPEATRKASAVAKEWEESKAAEIAELQAAWDAAQGAPHKVEQIARLRIERENQAAELARSQAASQAAHKNAEIENAEVVRPITTTRDPYCPTCNSYNEDLGHRLNCMYCGNPLPAAPINQSDVPYRSVPYKSDKAM